EPHRHAVAHCYRCHTMVEPRLSKQWFVKMRPLAKKAIEIVKKKKLKFHPARWTKVYLNWMENIKDWCISRQIWWGHRIPVYYCKTCNEVIVSKVKPEQCPECSSKSIVQDEDVLDTWFSSWLWPFSTLGWPDKSKDLEYFYPTDTLVTAQEIIFFWVARMVMAGLEFMKESPFSDVYIHGTVRDDTGTKMSKSLGNTIDPLDIINEFGADALRFSIISITAVGQDVFLSRQKFELGRNFANKVWNASRLIQTNLDTSKIGVDLCKFYDKDKLQLKERWILSRFYRTLGKVGEHLDAYKINEAAKAIYDFFWHEFCDWYLELAKSTFSDENTQVVVYKVLEKSLRMLHPFTPFITEEIWQAIPHEGDSIMVATWPHMQKQLIDKKADKDMQLLIEVITSIRTTRSTWRIEHNKNIDAYLKTGNTKTIDILDKNSEYIKRLARVENLKIEKGIEKPEASAAAVCGDIEIYIPLEGVIDYEKEKTRLQNTMGELIKRLDNTSSRLKNKRFLQSAPKEVIEKFKATKEELKSQIKKLKSNLKSLE
ncbi:MAG: class I tRNA ligase family protein, partial [Candidatus Omnitrophica bacterium]|nr:class I tRNA ligase family protein [Candidatus Omnitrophota bacterium]